MHKRLAILVGGGPAPGINSVIGAATIRACLSGYEVLGVQDGFRWLMEGDTSHVHPLSITETSRIHFRGGSMLGISRANPTKDPLLLHRTVQTLEGLGVSKLVTIGGDDTAFSAHRVAQTSQGAISVVHVPKTIDNDLDLPHDVVTFGFQTARHIGVELVKNLMVDAKTTSRWYFIVAMGRKAGHLALGIGKAAGATVTIIPEEFARNPRLSLVVDTLVGAIIKRLSMDRRDGVAVIAEGVVLGLDPEDLAKIKDVEKDAHGNLRIAEVDIGEILKRAVLDRLREFGIKPTVVAKNVGYELRCADPIPSDMEYTRDLGYCAASYILGGGTHAMVTLVDGHFKELPFAQMLDPATGRTRVRLVDINSEHYKIARRYMVRLRREDFDDVESLRKLAGAANLTVDEFRTQFCYLVDNETPPLRLGAAA